MSLTRIQVTSIVIGRDARARAAAGYLRLSFPRRFRHAECDSRKLFAEAVTLGLGEADVVHIDGGHGGEIFANHILTVLARCPVGTRVIVDGVHVPAIAETLRILLQRAYLRAFGDLQGQESACYRIISKIEIDSTEQLDRLLRDLLLVGVRDAGTSATPITNLPALVVFGDFDHFNRPLCFLGQLDGRLFSVIPSAEWVSRGRPRPAAFIKWAPWSTYSIPEEERRLLPPGARVLNDTHFHCDKTNVHRHMEAVFGYSARIDPLRFRGAGVVKSSRNAAHDGRIVQFPIDALEPDKVYERLIDSRLDDATFAEIRLIVLMGRAPFAFLKHRAIEQRFLIPSRTAEIRSPSELLSGEELTNVLTFCESIGLEYGELDILRDNQSKLIYVLDANNTPRGPPLNMPEIERERARVMLADAFEAALAELIVAPAVSQSGQKNAIIGTPTSSTMIDSGRPSRQ